MLCEFSGLLGPRVFGFEVRLSGFQLGLGFGDKGVGLNTNARHPISQPQKTEATLEKAAPDCRTD